ncbi:MAG: phage coat protein [Lachnospirales bacterium]
MAKFDSKSFNPQAFGAYVGRIPQLKKNELIKCGVLKGNSAIKKAFSSQTGTAYAILPMYGLLDGDVLNYDGQTDITSTSTTTYERGVVVVGRAKAWTEMDFAEDITGGAGFMDNVAQQVAEYFDAVDQTDLLAILEGIFNMTGTENKKFVDNHTYDISEIDEGIVGPSTLNSAIQKAGGDNKSKFTMVIMHSSIATNLENLKLLAYMKQTDAQGIERELGLATWNGRTVIIDDDMPVEDVSASGEGDTAVEAHTLYTTYVLGKGAFDYENIGAKTPYEMDRDPAKNGGQDTLYARQRKCYAPFGISYTKKSQASLSPTVAELKNGSNWELVNDGTGSKAKYINHKAIPIARIISKG